MSRREGITLYRARWVVPVGAPEIEDGAVAVIAGTIIDVGDSRHLLRTHRGEIVNLGDAILMPGFVNAHTHLELSALKGEVETGTGFVDWVRQVMVKMTELPREQVERAMAREVREVSTSGTVLLGDVTNTGLSHRFLAGSSLKATLFHEVLGFRSGEADDIFNRCIKNIEELREEEGLRSTVCPHGPHSVSPRLFEKVLAYIGNGSGVTTVHLAESYEEDVFIREGCGPFREFLEERGVWEPSWERCLQGPVSYLDGLGFLRPGTLCVHLVRASEDDLRLLARRGAATCVCPRSNGRTGVGRAPVEAMLRAGLRVALGTDSLASNDDLNILAEAQCLFGESPGIPPKELVRMFTLSGAEVLGWPELGSIARGKRARFALAPVTSGRCKDPYEYLLERVGPGEVKVV